MLCMGSIQIMLECCCLSMLGQQLSLYVLHLHQPDKTSAAIMSNVLRVEINPLINAVVA